MALATDQNTITSTQSLNPTTPISLTSEWLDIHTAPNVVDDATLTAIAELDTTSIPLNVGGKGTKVMLRLKYDDGVSSLSASPIIKVFLKDENGLYHFAKDASGSLLLTITPNFTTDFENGTFGYSDFVEVDMDASIQLVVGVQTAFAATGTVTTSTIQAKVK